MGAASGTNAKTQLTPLDTSTMNVLSEPTGIVKVNALLFRVTDAIDAGPSDASCWAQLGIDTEALKYSSTGITDILHVPAPTGQSITANSIFTMMVSGPPPSIGGRRNSIRPIFSTTFCLVMEGVHVLHNVLSPAFMRGISQWQMVSEPDRPGILAPVT